MKTFILTLTTCLFFSTGIYSQLLDPVIAPIDTSQQIKDIENICENIKGNMDNLARIPVFRDSLSFRDVYLQDNQLQLVKIQHIEENIEKNIEWYFFAEKLIFAESNWISKETGKTVANMKCYFSNSHMIAWINDNKYMNSGSEEFRQREKQLINFSKTLWVNAMKKE